MKKNIRPEKGDTVFFNPFGAVSVDSQKKKNSIVLLVDGEDVYGWFVDGKVKPVRENEARFSLRVPVIKDDSGQEVPAQEAVVLDVFRGYDLS